MGTVGGDGSWPMPRIASNGRNRDPTKSTVRSWERSLGESEGTYGDIYLGNYISIQNL